MFKEYIDFITVYTKSVRSKQDGLTLLEIAVGLVVVGILIVPLIQTYKTNLIKNNKIETRGDLANVQNAINQYYTGGIGAYPCPAGLMYDETSTRFGDASNCTAVNFANISLCGNSPGQTTQWQANGGICKTSATMADAAIIGAVPFATLNMQQEEALDRWGNKLIYAVTYLQTDVATFAASPGAISGWAVDSAEAVASGMGTPSEIDGIPQITLNAIDIFLFSTGRSGIGGFSKDGVPLAACDVPNANVLGSDNYERENCDFDSQFFYDKNPDYIDGAAFADGAGQFFYDDITLSQDFVPAGDWFQHPDNSTYGGDEYVLTSSNRIGIGTTTPDVSLDVVGNIRIQGGLNTPAVCDQGGGNCFDPVLISGNEDDMECDPDPANDPYGNQGVVRLLEGKFYCNSAVYGETDVNGNPTGTLLGKPIDGENDGIAMQVDTSVISGNTGNASGSCNPGELVKAIKADGSLECAIP